MNTVSSIFLGIAIVSALCGVASALMVVVFLQKHGVKINWFWFRTFLLIKYLGQYRDITLQETGRTGPLFYVYILSMNITLVTAIAGLVLR